MIETPADENADVATTSNMITSGQAPDHAVTDNCHRLSAVTTTIEKFESKRRAVTLSPKRKCDGDGEGAASGSASLHAAQARIEGVAAQVVEAARKTALEEAEVQTAARTLASHALRTEEELQWQAQRAATELAWRETSARNSV